MKRSYLAVTIVAVCAMLFSQTGFAASSRNAPAGASLKKTLLEALNKPAASSEMLSKKDLKRNHKLAHKKAKLKKKLAKLKNGKNGRRYSERGLLAMSIGFLIAGIVLLIVDVTVLRVLGVIAILVSLAFFIIWLLQYAGHI